MAHMCEANKQVFVGENDETHSRWSFLRSLWHDVCN